MNTVAHPRTGSATDRGLQRSINEDRLLVDNARGIFLVVDGLGGHAAGETAAQVAVEVISEKLAAFSSDIEADIRGAITAANNRILTLAQENVAWQGMACVLTLAVLHEGHIVFGHVGDSRLYLFWNGRLRKLTSDHSPVGELEDEGELGELEAMHHPRRNEIFRDVGSAPRQPGDPAFIQTRSLVFRPDAALLLCSDGLSDTLTSAEITAILDEHGDDPDEAAHHLIAAANRAGGPDNVSVVFVAGSDFVAGGSEVLAGARPRHAITRIRAPESRRRWNARSLLWLALGIFLGILFAIAFERRVDLADFFGRWLSAVSPHKGIK